MPRSTRRVYDTHKLLELVLDKDSFFEIQPHFGRSRFTGLARVDGYPVGVMANNPKLPGRRDGQGRRRKDRAPRSACDTFHLPIVYFCDEPGFMVGVEEEKKGIIRAGARMVALNSLSRTPFITFILRQVYGVAGGLHYRGGSALYRRYAWPSGHWGSMHIEGGVSAAYRREIDDGARSGSEAAEIEARLNELALTVPHSARVCSGGPDRPTRHASAAGRLRRGGSGGDKTQLGQTSRIAYLP